MKRDIKFKGYDKLYRKWHYGMLGYLGSKNETPTIIYFEEGQRHQITVYKDSIGQYIGFEDKNGTPIYEGDVVRVKISEKYKGRTVEYNWHFINDQPFYVIYDEGCFALKQDDRGMDYPMLFNSWALELEVIGTRYENKELVLYKGED